MAYQLGFDIQALIDEATLEAAGPWQGAPLGYTSDYYTPTELAEAFERDSSGTPEATGDAATGSAGWMVLDGCKTPVFRYVGAGEGTLTDVAVSVQQYEPAV